MRPASKAWKDAYSAFVAEYGRTQADALATGIIEIDREEVERETVAKIVAFLRQLDATRDESNLIGWAANRIASGDWK